MIPALDTQLRFRDTVADLLGLVFDDNRLDQLAALLAERAQANNVEPEDYIGTLETGSREIGVLAEALTIGETYFFRHLDQFTALRDTVLPERIRAQSGTRRLSILSAGCSTGEEPYSIAMLMADIGLSEDWQVSLRGIDINPASLRRAREGRYGRWSLREMPEAMARWFTPHGREFVVTPQLRNAVQFELDNLADIEGGAWMPGAYDVIFCRNVIMYFAPELQRAVVARLAAALAPGGYLFMGHAESLRGLSDAFELISAHNTFFYRRKSTGRVDIPRAGSHAPSKGWAWDRRIDTLQANPDWFRTIQRASDRVEQLNQRLTDGGAPLAAEADRRPSAVAALRAAYDAMATERFADALQLLDDLPDAQAANADARVVRAAVLLQMGRAGEAQEISQAQIERDPLCAAAHQVLGLCCELRNEPEAALRHYGVAAHLDRHFAMPRLRGGMLARRLGRGEEARGQLRLARSLLGTEQAGRLTLFGGGFSRNALVGICDAELRACGDAR